jgi:RecA/RadA recombinase
MDGYLRRMVCIPTGLPRLDAIIGGYVGGMLHFIYGEEKSGKTSLALLAAANAIKLGGKVVWVDCGQRMHVERLLQVLFTNRADTSKLILTPVKDFDEQEITIISLLEGTSPSTKLIVLDDYTYLHRIAMKGEVREDAPIFKRLAFQTASLKEVALTNGIPIIMVGQAHEVPGLGTKPVASRIVGYWSDVILRLENTSTGIRVLKVEKGGPTFEQRFRITDAGVEALGL